MACTAFIEIKPPMPQQDRKGKVQFKLTVPSPVWFIIMVLSSWAVFAARWSYKPDVISHGSCKSHIAVLLNGCAAVQLVFTPESVIFQQDRKSKLKHKLIKLEGVEGEGSAPPSRGGWLHGVWAVVVLISLIFHGIRRLYCLNQSPPYHTVSACWSYNYTNFHGTCSFPCFSI